MKKIHIIRHAVVLLLTLTVVLAGSLSIAQDTPKQGGSLKYGSVADMNMDPHIYIASSGKVVSLCMYNSLLTFNENGEIVPSLAESWETPDAKTYIFKLRQGVKFHKGQPFSAKDVKYSLERIMDPETGSSVSPYFEGCTITIVDDYTIKIEKDTPDATLLGILAMPETGILSEEWMKTNPNTKVEENGTGPFSLAEFEPKVRVLVKRNPEYFEEGLPRLDQIEFKIINDSEARVNALRTGAVDMIELVPWKDIDMLKQQRGLEVETAGGAFMNLWLNTSKKPFDDPRVRQAIAYAIDREGISIAAFFGYGTPLFGPPATPDSWYYNEDLADHFSYDPEKAKQLLADAGYADGFEVELNVYHGLPIYTQTGQIVQANLKEIGIDVGINLLEWATVVERKNKAQYDFLIWGANLKLPDPDVYSFYFGSESSYWAKPVGFVDEKLEELLKNGRSNTDLEQRKAIYHEVEERILELSPWVFINWRAQVQAYKSSVKGYVHLGGALSESGPGMMMKYLWLSE